MWGGGCTRRGRPLGGRTGPAGNAAALQRKEGERCCPVHPATPGERHGCDTGSGGEPGPHVPCPRRAFKEPVLPTQTCHPVHTDTPLPCSVVWVQAPLGLTRWHRRELYRRRAESVHNGAGSQTSARCRHMHVPISSLLPRGAEIKVSALMVLSLPARQCSCPGSARPGPGWARPGLSALTRTKPASAHPTRASVPSAWPPCCPFACICANETICLCKACSGWSALYRLAMGHAPTARPSPKAEAAAWKPGAG